MTILYRTTAKWLCRPLKKRQTEVQSDGEDGPDDGSGHVHPEKPFHFDMHSKGPEGLLLD